MPFEARRVPGDAATIVQLSGEIDLESAPRMRAALEAALRIGLPIVIDMSGVTFVDSTGFGVLVATHLQAKQVGVSVLVRAVSGRVRVLMEMMGLDTVLEIEAGTPRGSSSR